MDRRPQFPELERPPIDEVVCGIVFEPVAELDALALGVYWGERRDTYPLRSLLPAVRDDEPMTVRVGVPPMRAFLVNVDDQFVLQLQHDRFFMNWRNRGRGYPRFSTRHGEDGLLKRALMEYARFVTFVADRFGQRLKVRRIDLTKIDMLRRGEHWSDLDDLGKLLPITATVGLKGARAREIDLQFVDRGAFGAAVVHIVSAPDAQGQSDLRMQFRLSRDANDAALAEAFDEANTLLNEAFFRLIPTNQLRRFGAMGGR